MKKKQKIDEEIAEQGDIISHVFMIDTDPAYTHAEYREFLEGYMRVVTEFWIPIEHLDEFTGEISKKRVQTTKRKERMSFFRRPSSYFACLVAYLIMSFTEATTPHQYVLLASILIIAVLGWVNSFRFEPDSKNVFEFKVSKGGKNNE